KLASQSIYIGPPPSAKSYLNQEKLISVAKEYQADAIHPGYGFLAENNEFCDNCKRNDIIFIGPNAESIKNMGNKIKAIQHALDADVPVVSDTTIKNNDLKHIKLAAEKIGYPILLKAAAGGGGKGMKIVYQEEELEKE